MIKTTTLSDARRWMQEGDLLLYSGTGFVSSVIQAFGKCRFSHAAMVGMADGRPRVLEVREWHGGREISLGREVKNNPGRIAWLPLDPHHRFSVDRRLAVREMRRFSGCNYGYMSVLRTGLSHFLGTRFFFKPSTDDEVNPKSFPYCSDVCSRAYRVAGQDPVERLAHANTEPCDLYHSLLFDDPVFLVPDDPISSSIFGPARDE